MGGEGGREGGREEERELGQGLCVGVGGGMFTHRSRLLSCCGKPTPPERKFMSVSPVRF